LRKSAKERGLKTLLYEAGEALRFDEDSIIIGVRGVLNVMSALGMVASRSMPDGPAPIIAKDSHWIRAPQSGSLRVLKEHGAWVAENELLGVITDPYGGQSAEVRSRSPGWIIASVTMPLVNLGNALFHIATTDCIRQDGTDTCFFPNVVRDQDVDIENEGW
jgi:predicted deacylase